MGAGIAQVSTERGIPSTIKDVSMEGLAKGQNYIQLNLKKKVKRKFLSNIEADKVCLLNNRMFLFIFWWNSQLCGSDLFIVIIMCWLFFDAAFIYIYIYPFLLNKLKYNRNEFNSIF